MLVCFKKNRPTKEGDRTRLHEQVVQVVQLLNDYVIGFRYVVLLGELVVRSRKAMNKLTYGHSASRRSTHTSADRFSNNI